MDDAGILRHRSGPLRMTIANDCSRSLLPSVMILRFSTDSNPRWKCSIRENLPLSRAVLKNQLVANRDREDAAHGHFWGGLAWLAYAWPRKNPSRTSKIRGFCPISV
jgi:hypothetical protein